VIHLDQNSAALFAQVLPVLTLVLLLEGRVPIKKYRSASTAFFFETVRFTTAIYGTTATLLCLWFVATKTEPSFVIDLWISAGFWSVSGASIMFAFQMCWGPLMESWKKTRQESRKATQDRRAARKR
jgi:hypothetical protein